MSKGVSPQRLLASVAFHGVSLAGLGIGGVTKLDEDRLALPCALDRRSEEAPSTIRDGRLHGFADDLGHEHALPQAMARIDLDPIKSVFLDVLRVAEGAGGGLKRNE